MRPHGLIHPSPLPHTCAHNTHIHTYTAHLPLPESLPRWAELTKMLRNGCPSETSSLSEERKADHTSARAPALWEGMKSGRDEVLFQPKSSPTESTRPRSLTLCLSMYRIYWGLQWLGHGGYRLGARYYSWWAPPAGLMPAAVMWASTPAVVCPVFLKYSHPSHHGWLRTKERLLLSPSNLQPTESASRFWAVDCNHCPKQACS